MADLKDRFKFDEILKKPSMVAPRDTSGGIVVRKKDGIKQPEISVKRGKPYGSEPIRDKIKTPKTKEELVKYYDSEYQIENESDVIFSGETSGYIEIPKYNEEELKKAVDVKVDELIKPKKQQKGEWVPKPTHDKLVSDYEASQTKVLDLEGLLAAEKSKVAQLESQLATLNATIQALNDELVQKDVELASFLERYNKLLDDYQNSVIKGTKEGIERVSLTAQVKGLQAQKEVLKGQITSYDLQLQAQQDVVKSLQQQAEIQQQVAKQQEEAAKEKEEQLKKTSLLDIVGQRDHYQVKGTVAWASAVGNLNRQPKMPLWYDDRKKDPRHFLTGAKFEFYNIGDEDVTLSVTDQVTQGGKKWVSGVPNSISVPKSPDGGVTPGMKSVTFNRTSTNHGKGTYESILKFKNTTTQEELQIKTHYWQARSRRST